MTSVAQRLCAQSSTPRHAQLEHHNTTRRALDTQRTGWSRPRGGEVGLQNDVVAARGNCFTALQAGMAGVIRLPVGAMKRCSGLWDEKIVRGIHLARPGLSSSYAMVR